MSAAAKGQGRRRTVLQFPEVYTTAAADHGHAGKHGMIRKVIGATTATTATTANAPASTAKASTPSGGQSASDRPGATLENPVRPTPASIAGGKRTYDAVCAVCHGNQAQGAVKAGIAISIIEEQKGKQPPDLTDDQSDHGSTDGDMFTVIKRGVPSTMMPGFTGQLTDGDIWNIVNYVRSLQPRATP